MNEENQVKSSIKPTVTPIKAKPNIVKPSPVKKGSEVNPNNFKKSGKEEDEKKKRKFFIWIIILFLVLLLCGGVIWLITSIPKNTMSFEIKVYSDVVTEIVDPNDGSLSKIKYVPGNNIKSSLDIEIRNKNGTPVSYEKVFLRFKIDIIVDDNQYSQLFDPILSKAEYWCKGDDGYYYYYDFCYGYENDGKKIQVFDELEFVANRNNNVLNGKSGKLCFYVEILEGEFNAINDYWHTAPQQWRTTVGSGETF